MGQCRVRARICRRPATYLITAALLLAAASARAASPLVTPPEASWSLSLRSTGYAFQTEDPAGTSEDHLRLYQHFAGTASGLAGGHLTFRASGRFANDPAVFYPGFENGRLHTGLLEARLGSRFRAQVGRQFLQSGVASLTLDGARLAYRGSRMLNASVWGGARAPFGHGYEVAKFNENAAAGGRVELSPGRGHRLGLSAAYRESGGVVAERPLGVEYTLSAVRNLRALGRVAYDLEGDRWSRFEAQADWRPAAGRPVVTVQYVDRYPSIDAASWFRRFTEVKRIKLARMSLRWESERRFGGELEYVGSYVDSRTASRFGIAALLPFARIGYSVRIGDVGDENSIYGEIGWQARSWLRLEGEASYLTYALFADAPEADERDLTTLAARARVNLRSGLNLFTEVQSLDNPLYKHDVRFLVGVDLAMGRGTSRFGLDRGGWLQ